jgi:putative transposase
VVTLDELAERVAGAYGLEPPVLSAHGRQRRPSEARALIAALATEARAATLSEVARRFDRDVATLSEGVQRVRLRARSSSAFRERFDGLGMGVVTEKS